MTEHDWLSCSDPQAILSFVRENGRLFDRKARLFAVACCRRIWPLLTDERSRTAVVVVEQYADGESSKETLDQNCWHAGWAAAWAGQAAAAEAVAWAASTDETMSWVGTTARRAAEADQEMRVMQTILLRDLFVLIRTAAFQATWRLPAVLELAHAAYHARRLPEGDLRPDRLAALAAALEAAGCDYAGLLAHLRSEGPHWRGCWGLDVVLGRE